MKHWDGMLPLPHEYLRGQVGLPEALEGKPLPRCLELLHLQGLVIEASRAKKNEVLQVLGILQWVQRT